MHVVVSNFYDLEDDRRLYEAGQIFPREGAEVSEKRLELLSSDKNAAEKVLIKFVEDPQTPVEEPGKEEKKKPKKKKDE